MSGSDASFWERVEQVERFASREPDHRLAALVEQYADHRTIRVLDVGCAGGRNTEFLARLGFDVWAVDAARAMVERTRGRLAPIIGAEEASARVTRGGMDRLTRFRDGEFHLVVALGVYHQAPSEAVWRRALEETARVLRPAGRLLVATFDPRSRPDGTPLEPVAGQPHLYHGFPSGPLYLVAAGDLDRSLARVGLVPEVPTETVEVRQENGGCRFTVNGLYRRAARENRP